MPGSRKGAAEDVEHALHHRDSVALAVGDRDAGGAAGRMGGGEGGLGGAQHLGAQRRRRLVAQQAVDGGRVGARVGDVFLPGGEGGALGAHQTGETPALVAAQRGRIDPVERVELHQHQDAVGVGRHHPDREPAIARFEGLDPFRLVSGEVGGGRHPALRPGGRRDRLRDLALVEDRAPVLGDQTQRPGERGLADDGAGRQRLAVRIVDVPAAGIALDVLSEKTERAGKHAGQRVGFGERRGIGEQIGPGKLAVALVHPLPAPDHAGHAEGERPAQRDAAGVKVERRPPRRVARGVQSERPTVPGPVVEDERIAPERSRVRHHHRQRGRAGDRGVRHRAPALERAKPGERGQRVARDHHPPGAVNRRAGDLHPREAVCLRHGSCHLMRGRMLLRGWDRQVACRKNSSIPGGLGPIQPGALPFRIEPPPRHARTCSGHPRLAASRRGPGAGEAAEGRGCPEQVHCCPVKTSGGRHPLVISTGAGPKGRRSGEISPLRRRNARANRFLRSALRAPVEMTKGMGMARSEPLVGRCAGNPAVPTPCTRSTKVKPDSNGTSPGMTRWRRGRRRMSRRPAG